jgi:hypothetical protein
MTKSMKSCGDQRLYRFQEDPLAVPFFVLRDRGYAPTALGDCSLLPLSLVGTLCYSDVC